MTPTRHHLRAAAGGFTLVELMVVIAVIGLITRIAIVNLGALVPSTLLDGECKTVRSHLDYLRSEARLRGQACSLELDLTNHRYRYVLPTERRLASHEEEINELPLTWRGLDERVRFAGIAVPSRPVLDGGLYKITFDDSGSTGDIAIFFKLPDAENQYVWTLQLRGLTGRTEIKKSIDGKRHALEETNESAF